MVLTDKKLIALCEIVSELAYLASCQGWKFDHIEGAQEIIELTHKRKHSLDKVDG